MSFDVAKLAPGDPVAHTWSARRWEKDAIVNWSTVERITPSFIILADRTKFHRESGASIAAGRGRLIDPNGERAQAYFWWCHFFETKEAIDRLPEPARPVTREEVLDWLDAVSAVVEECRTRLREIGGGRDA